MNEREIFIGALQVECPTEQRAYLDRACGPDTVLRRRVEGLLRDCDRAASFLSAPAISLAGTVEELIAERPGTLIGPYKLMEQIGEGGMGLVFVAEQSHPVRRKVALKLIKPGMDSRQVIARFEAERQALAMMDHPNIAKVHDGGVTPEGRPYFVMELVKGLPITDYCDKNRLGTRQRLELFLDVCHAVQHAHQKGIIHRDLKPSNILVEVHDVRPVVKIIDFGISKAIGQQLTDKTLYTGMAHMVGTPMYMSPEQAGLSSLDVDTRSDVYSLGVLLYELLTGTTPFESETLKKAGYDEMRRIIREEEPPKPSTRLSTLQDAALSTIAEQRGVEPRKLGLELRRELDWVVMKALEKDRNRRYESASALAADVQRYLRDEPVQACPPSRRYRLGKFLRKHQRGLLTAAALVVVVVGCGWILLDRAGQRAEADRQRAATEEAVAEDMKEADAWHRQEQWAKIVTALERAKLRLQGSGLGSLQDQVHKRLREMALVLALEEAQLRAAELSLDPFALDFKRDYAGADQAYKRAFVDNGLDVDGAPAEELARQVRASSVGTQLISALEYWAVVKDRLPGGNGEPLRAIACSADDDPWRQRLRQTRLSKGLQGFAGLAEDEGVLAQPPVNLLLLCSYLDSIPGTPRPWSPADRATRDKARAIAVQLLKRAYERHPADFWVNIALAIRLDQSDPDAIGYLRAALALETHNPGVHHTLGTALLQRKRLPEAVAAYQKAIRLNPNFAAAHYSLGNAYKEQHELSKAALAYRKAIDIKPNFAPAYIDLCYVLNKQGEHAKAEAVARTALKVRPGDSYLYTLLGDALHYQRKLDEAIAAYRRGIELGEKDANLLNGLGAALRAQHELRDAEEAFRKAIQLQPTLADAHFNLGLVLTDQEKLPKAAESLRKAIELDRNNVQYHWNLGRAYQRAGQFAESLAALKEAHEIASRRTGWNNSSSEWVRAAEEMLALDAKLPKILKGEELPRDSDERRGLAYLCALPCRQLYALAARFYSEAFSADPKSAPANRYNAACAAALAGCGHGKDADKLAPEDCARLRGQALAWLRADLKTYLEFLEKQPDKVRRGVGREMERWQHDPDFTGVRGEAPLAKLPEAERQEWRALWEEVAALGRRAGAK
jgi:serine/threonine protein kinase/Flp pilus assembly protein TadD